MLLNKAEISTEMLPVEVADPGTALEDNSCAKAGTDALRVSVVQLRCGSWARYGLVTFCSGQAESVS